MTDKVRLFRGYIPDNVAPLPDLNTRLPLDVEIGCGAGLHPIQYGGLYPDRQLIAIEHTREKFNKFLTRMDHHNLPRVFAIHGNGISFVCKHLGSSSVDRYFFLYPNPNPKPSQKNKRWHNMAFMAKVVETLKPGGSITLATNEKWYYLEACVAYQRWGLETTSSGVIKAESHIPRTHFEKKYLLRGEVCYQLLVTKTSTQ